VKLTDNYWNTGSGGKPSSPLRNRDRQRDNRLEGHSGVTSTARMGGTFLRLAALVLSSDTG